MAAMAASLPFALVSQQHTPLFRPASPIPFVTKFTNKRSGFLSSQSKSGIRITASVNPGSAEETKRRASSQSCDDIKDGDSTTHNLTSVGNPNAITPGLGNDKYSSGRTVALCVCAAVAFGVILGMKDGVGKASEFFAGYLLEQSLSVDNLFVFVLIFRYFKVPIIYQRFEVVNLLLASVLLFSSYKMFAGEEEETDLSNNFIVKTCQKFIPVTSNYDGDRFFKIQDGAWQATPLLLTVAVIELSDIAFAVDSIPAVFGVTRDPFVVFSSNLFAILGLRSLYTLISESMSDLEYIQPSIGVVLGFIGCKMILDFFGYHVSTEASLGFVATSISCGVLLSLIRKKSD
ncbi:thylakoid membrane protein TERC, chloroplastic isoform X2 [Magnolia sinica]|uniref:thylakoid membrane protein TERC, chloroplastic isoform X2 n=1 Tax=Magnolia sinica TaxID=86752 RepID=UPI00265A9D12|nr:thylakoid membrane protein TERC, chloroplastic isoform X2 [Magnolia sinica]